MCVCRKSSLRLQNHKFTGWIEVFVIDYRLIVYLNVLVFESHSENRNDVDRFIDQRKKINLWPENNR